MARHKCALLNLGRVNKSTNHMQAPHNKAVGLPTGECYLFPVEGECQVHPSLVKEGGLRSEAQG